MYFISNFFIIFVAVAVALYYIIPQRRRWIALLFVSYIYYLLAGPIYILYLLFSTVITYVCGRMLRAISEKRRKKMILIAGLILNFGMLGILKYVDFIFQNINTVFGTSIPGMHFLLPLGISFYTFQSSGYLLDVYWRRTEPEKNPFRYALFISFFPQLLQGPIGRFDRLAPQLYKGNRINFTNISGGLSRILWGYFKKIVVADWAAIFVDAIFNGADLYPGLSLFGVLFYSIQLYADFSGGVDVVIGIASLFGISMDENFKRPYFAVSITDFWRRWHITLGTWMKDYVFYPVSMSGHMRKMGNVCSRLFGKKIGRKIPICFSNVIVFFLVGIWHGAQWKYVAYGLYNGILIAVSGLLADRFKWMKKQLHINERHRAYRFFCILRTFILVNISWFFDCTQTVRDAFCMMGSAVTSFRPSVLLTIPAGREGISFTPYALAIVCAGSFIIFCISVLQEKGINVRDRISRMPFALTCVLYICLFVSIGFFGSTSAARGFIYAQF